MQTQNRNPAIAWLVFFISLIAFILAIYFHFSYLTLILPFLLTSFVYAMDII